MNLRMNHGAKIALVAACLLGCGPKLQKSASQLSSIIDQNTMVVIDANTKLDDQIKRNLGAIGKMTGGCTAFHLGHGIVASAGHCIELAKQAWQQSTCYSIDIIWGQTLESQSPDHSRCMRILDYRYDEQVDYALFQVDPVPSASIEIEPVPRDLRTSAQAIVVGYPKNQTLNWSGICEANWSGRSDSQFFHHRCDTLPGNSGSPVLDAETSKVLGIHNGDADSHENYGSFLPPAADLLKLVRNVEAPLEAPQQLQFGPFDNQMSQNLHNFSTQQASAVSFDLKYNIEDGYDKLILIDGKGRHFELTGSHQTHYEHLTNPVSLIIVTDYSGNSTSVSLSSIVYE